MANKKQPMQAVELRLPADVAKMVSAMNAVQVQQVLELGLNEVRKELVGTPAEEKTMLHHAAELISGARQAEYGDKLQNFSQIAMLFQGTLATKLRPTARVSAEDVALLMIQVKIARLAKSPDHKDSILDVAGYAGCYDILQNERIAGVELYGATQDSRAFE